MNQRVKTITTVGMLSAITYITVVLLGGKIQLVPGVAFLKYDPKDIVIALGGFIWGPATAALVSVIVSFLEMITISTTGPIGCIMNILSSCAFALPAALIYKKKRNLSGAVIGLLSGCLAMTAMMVLWNYTITPYYMTGVTRKDIVAMLIPVFLPFNALKGVLNMSFTFLLYRPITLALRSAGILPKSKESSEKKNPVILWISAAALILGSILFSVFWSGNT